MEFNSLTGFWEPGHPFDNEASEGVTFPLGRLEFRAVDAEDAVGIHQRGLALKDDRVLIDPRVQDVLVVEFIRDVADDFLDDILEGHEATRSAVLVHDNGEVDLHALEIPKQVVDHPILRDEEGLAQERVPIHVLLVPVGEEVLGVEDAIDLVQSFGVDGDAAESALGHLGLEFRPSEVVGERRHVRPGGHDLLDVFGPEVDDAAQDAVLLFRAVIGIGDLNGVLQILHGQFGRGRVHP